jgi:NodT family efflux transporter outer membrane factor (OMF) lipoprotein
MKSIFYMKMNKAFECIMIISTFVMLSGCMTVGPDYSPPEMKTPGKWQKDIGDASDRWPINETLGEWWKTFNDPVLNALIEKAVSGNLGLKEALSRVRQARLQSGITEADQFPSVDSSGSVSRSYSENMSGDFSGTNSFRLGMDASWELDIFGGVKRSIEASEADLQATKEYYRNILVSLLAETATNYIQLRSYQSRLSVAEANLKFQEETYNIAKWRHKAGLTTELDVERAKANLEGTRAQIPSLKNSLDKTKHQIAVLLGIQPGALGIDLDQVAPIPVAPQNIAVGIPADLLSRRPDLRKAERDLAAQTARIGTAEARRYPRITLSGSIGLDSLKLVDLVGKDSLSAGVSSGISWPVFKAGSILKNIELQWELRDQALLTYKSTLLTALKDVENALTSYSYELERREYLLREVQSVKKSAEISRSQYSAGLIDFQTVLDAERSLLSSQDLVVQSDAQVILNIISLYKALGGGWENDSFGKESVEDKTVR